jgi:hypothetical protein
MRGGDWRGRPGAARRLLPGIDEEGESVPNGGPDNCGMCQFNPARITRSGSGGPLGPDDFRCEIRGTTTALTERSSPMYSYCANFHTGSRTPDGPVFAATPAHDRLPWHGDSPVWFDFGEEAWTARAVHVRDGDTELTFDTEQAYMEWWRGRHPGEFGEYPWRLHELAYRRAERASGHDEE